MSSPRTERIQEVPAKGNNSPVSPKPVCNGPAPKDGGDAGDENAKKLANALGEQSPDNMPKVLSFQPTGAIAAQPQSIWYKYVTIAEKWDRRMMEKWKTNMNNLLIFAALFTAIVTAFVLDAMSDLDEDTSTKLLRLLVEQSATNSTIEMPPSNPPSSTLTVSSLWFLSIMSSLAATTWAILCLEWCAFLTDGVQAEDYEEMAEKRQRRFEAVKRWRMHLIIAAIPFFLHLSLFLFLAGLWLRLRDVNKQLGLIVGVPSLIIASSYVVVTLLPVFTDAPFSTSASELIQPIIDAIKRVIELRRFIRPPRIVPWIKSRLPVWISSRTLISFTLLPRIRHLWTRRFTVLAKRIYRVVGLYIRTAWKTVTFLPIIPTFGSDKNPFKELNKLKVGRSGRDKGIHLRALFWLMNTPLSKDEVKEILKEFRYRGSASREPLDRTIIRLLVLSLSSVLENNDISEDEQPIFDHCTTVLADEMDRAFENGEHNQRILFRNKAVFEKLSPHFHLTTSGEGAPNAHLTASGGDYWSRAIPALWLCPSQETVGGVVDQLDSNIRSMEALRLQRIVRGLHAATLTFFNPDQSTLDLIPDFSLWNWDSSSSDPGLDKALSSFLQDMFAAFFNTLPRSDRPITIPSLVADCLTVLDDQPERYTLKLHSALCFFVTVTRRSDPGVLEEGPSVAHALLASAESYKKYGGKYESKRANVLATRLRAIAYGPKSLITRQSRSLTRLGDLYTGLPDSIKTDPQCLRGFLDAYAATMEAVLAVDGHFTIFVWLRSPDCVAARNIFTNSLFTDDIPFDFVRQNPKYRLPYLYSLAIALSYTTEGRNQELWKVANLLVTRDEQDGITIDRALDTNILVVTVLKFTLFNQSETLEQGQKENFLELLRNINMEGTDWRTRWKSIYLIATLAFLLSQIDSQNEGTQQPQFLTDAATKSFEQVECDRVPSDWERKKKGLKLCKLESKVRSLANVRGEMCEGVYEWSSRENVPYLALYNPQRAAPEPISHAAYWAVTMLQRFVLDEPADPGEDSSSTHKVQGTPRISISRTFRSNDSRV